jgi:Family of unknown function (DUF6526)
MVMADSGQSFKSHTRWFPPFHFFVLPVLLVNVLNAGRHLWMDTRLSTAWGLVFAVALFMLAALGRQMVVTVQDRVIRLEERLRLRQVLPTELQPQINALTRQQLVGLRFADDAEVAELVRDIASGKITTAKEIKSRVKNWQPDLLRA